MRLFDRSTRRVQITEAGREFAAVAERMLNDLGITVQSVREVAQERRGLVVVSCVMSVAGGVLPRMIAAYRSGRPGVEIHLREGVYASILDDVRSGVAAGVGVGVVPGGATRGPPVPGVKVVPLAEPKLVRRIA